MHANIIRYYKDESAARSIVMHANIIRYYKDESAARSSAAPLGEIPLAGCTLQFGKDRLFVLCFPSGRTFEMRCLDDRSHGEWKARLEELASLKLGSGYH